MVNCSSLKGVFFGFIPKFRGDIVRAWSGNIFIGNWILFNIDLGVSLSRNAKTEGIPIRSHRVEIALRLVCGWVRNIL